MDSNCLSGAVKLDILFKDRYCIAPISFNDVCHAYPNKSDVINAHKKNKEPGGLIYIHGLNKRYAKVGKLHTLSDWTLGCIAVTNDEIDELYKLIKVGTKIEIKP